MYVTIRIKSSLYLVVSCRHLASFAEIKHFTVNIFRIINQLFKKAIPSGVYSHDNSPPIHPRKKEGNRFKKKFTDIKAAWLLQYQILYQKIVHANQ